MALTLVLTACSQDPLATYFDQASQTLDRMRSDSLEATPLSAEVTRDGVLAVTQARRLAVQSLDDIAPPNQVLPEHTALVIALRDLVAATDAFLAAHPGDDADAFEAAVLSATDIDTIVLRVALACEALDRRATDLSIDADIRC